jgi:hypothetical protein
MREVTRFELLKCDFSLEEIQQRAQSLARANQQAHQIEAEKKQVASDYKSRIEAVMSEVLALSSAVAMGYEMRRTECSVIYNSPTSGEKTLVRKDTGEYVRVERMTSEEQQEVFPFEPKEDKTNGTAALAALHTEAPLEEHMFAFTGRVIRMAIRVYRTRKGWHWMYGMSDAGSNASSVSSESPVSAKEDAITAGALALHAAVELAWRRNHKKLSEERIEDGRQCMEWARRIADDPTLAEDFCTATDVPQLPSPDDSQPAAE